MGPDSEGSGRSQQAELTLMSEDTAAMIAIAAVS
jgi:hypothetical protein